MTTRQATSLAKGLRLLGAIIDDDARSSLSAIAEDLGIPLATAHRLAVTLEAEGFLHRSRKGYYHPGPALATGKGYKAPAAHAAVRLRVPLARLARTHKAFTHFGVLEDGMVTYLVKEKGCEADLFTAEQAQLEAYCSGLGKVLLAALPPDELETYLANGPFVPLTRHTLTDPDDLRREIDTVRKAGVAFDRFEVRDDIYCVGVPVRDADRKVIGAISLSLVSRSPDAAELRQVRQKLRKIATRVQGWGSAPEEYSQTVMP